MSIFENIIKHFNHQIDAISNQTEALTPHLAEAAHLLSQTLIEDGKILCCSAGHNRAIAEHFCRSLDSFNTLRPAFPCLLLGNAQQMAIAMDNHEGDEVYPKAIHTLAKEQDTLVIFSLTGQEKSLQQAIEAANAKALNCIIIYSGSAQLSQAIASNKVDIALSGLDTQQSLNMQFMLSQLLVVLTEQLLFGEIEWAVFSLAWS